MIKFTKKNLFLILLIFLPIYPRIINKAIRETNFFIIKNSQNCDLEYIQNIPKGASIIVGHPYGSPIYHNGFISKDLEFFLKSNKGKLDKIFLTGDVFSVPTKENWENLYSLIGRNADLIIAPGNHDVGSSQNRILFNETIKHSTNFPITIKLRNRVILVEDSVLNNWLINSDIIDVINQNINKKPLILLRHNIPASDFISIANSKYGISRKLPTFADLSKKIKNETIIISGDGGAFKHLPRFFCRRKNNLTFILNGLGDQKEDIILVLTEQNLYKYRIN